MDLKESQTDSPGRRELPVIDVSSPHHQLEGRVSAIAASPNMIYVGTVAGDIRVIGRVGGESLNKRWAHESRPIEGLMFDHEGKMVYATEMNLVVVDREFKSELKEYRSHNPLRNRRLISAYSSDRKKNETQFGSFQGRLVGKQRLSHYSQPREFNYQGLPYGRELSQYTTITQTPS